MWTCGETYRWEMRIRLRPKRRASTDQAPGPSMARAAPSAASTTCMEAPLKEKSRRHSSERAMSAPATGVQSPTIKSAEQTAASNCRITLDGAVSGKGPAPNCASGTAMIARRNTNPVPGQPSGNVEKSRCTNGPAFRLLPVPAGRYPEKRSWPTPLSRCLKVDDAALQPYRHSVRSVVGAEFGKDVLDMTFSGLFLDGKLGCDLFVGVSAGNDGHCRPLCVSETGETARGCFEPRKR